MFFFSLRSLLWVIPVPSLAAAGPHRHLISLHNQQRREGNTSVLQLIQSKGRSCQNQWFNCSCPTPGHEPPGRCWIVSPAAVGELAQLAELEEPLLVCSLIRGFVFHGTSWPNGLAQLNIQETKEIFDWLFDQLRSHVKCHLRGSGQASLGWCCRNPTPAVRPDLLTGMSSSTPLSKW